MRKRGYASLIWGGLLVVLGLALLAENFDWLGEWNAPVWSLLLGALGLTFIATFLTDREQWWALIPGLVILGIATAVFLAEQELVSGYVVATLILAGVSLPFLLIFLMDREHWWALIPGMTMAGVAVAVFLEGLGLIGGAAVGGFILTGISLGFFSIYLVDGEQWWALFPGGAMGIMAFFLLIATAGEYIWPVALILLGLLLLRGSLGGGRKSRPVVSAPPESPAPERARPPTLEEQIEAAIADESEEKSAGSPASDKVSSATDGPPE